MPDEILERVPEIYAQEDVDLADTGSCSIYYLFRSNWTWYMTE